MFKKGDKKPSNSGRVKGVRNKRTYKLMDFLDKLGLDPVKEFFEAVALIDDPQQRAAELAKIFPFMMPKLASLTIEEKTPEQEQIEAMSMSELEAKAKQLLLEDDNDETKTKAKTKQIAAKKPL